MSIWKSPIFYLGLILVGLVVSALSAPYFINWNFYRGDIDGFASRSLGRDVVSKGPIAVKLFPWPRLEVQNVSVSNAEGFSETAFLQTEKLSIDLALAALIAGQVNIENIELTRPHLSIEVNAQGEGNWNFAGPQGEAKDMVFNRLNLNKITFTNGKFYFVDAKHKWLQSINGVAGEATAVALAGPWKLKATGKHGEGADALPLEFTAGLATLKSGEAPKFNFRLAASDGSWPALSFNGENSAGNVKGEFIIEPVITQDGRSTLDADFKPLLYRAKVDANANAVNLSEIKIVAADNRDNGTLIEGEGQVAFDDGLNVTLNLNSPRMDLDALAGTGVARVTDAGGLIGVANTWFKTMPHDINIFAKLTVSSITMAGESLSNLSISANSTEGGIRLNDLTTDLPGRSRMKFSGILFPGLDQAELAGNLAFESGDMRSFTQWLWPDSKLAIAQNWTGQRGRIKSTGDVVWNGKQFGFQNLRYELDGLLGRSDIAITMGQKPALNINLSADEFDLGAYVRGGFGSLNFSQMPLALLPSEGAIDRRIVVQIGKLHLNGVTAQGFKVDLDLNAAGIKINAIDFGNVQGAELRGNGTVAVGNDGPAGDVNFTIKAAQPEGLMRLMGFIPASYTPEWSKLFGQTLLAANLTVRPGKTEPLVNFDLSGDSGPFQILGSGDVQNLEAASGANWNLSGSIATGNGQNIFGLLNMRPKLPDTGGGRLAATIKGNQTTGFESSIDVQAYGANINYTGALSPSASLLGLNGKATIDVARSTLLLSTLGYPVYMDDAAPLKASLEIARGDKSLKLSSKDITFGAQKLALDGTLFASRVVNLKMNGGIYASADLAAVAMMSSNWLQQGFSQSWPFDATGEITLKPEVLAGPLAEELRDTTITLSLLDGEKRIKLRGVNGGDKVALDVSLTPEKGLYNFKSYVNYPIDLAALYGPDAMSGQTRVEGQFAATGRTIDGLLAKMSGTGIVKTTQVQAKGFDAVNFFAGMAGAKELAETELAAGMLTQGEGVAFPDSETSIDLENGAMIIAPLTAEDDQLIAELSANVDFAAKLMTTELGLRSKANADWPEAKILYLGAPQQMERKLDYADLARKLGAAFIAQDLADLDKIQEQQKQAELDAADQKIADQKKYDSFVAQRTELQLQRRMLKVFAAQRVRDGEYYKARVAKAIVDGAEMVKAEKRILRQRLP